MKLGFYGVNFPQKKHASSQWASRCFKHLPTFLNIFLVTKSIHLFIYIYIFILRIYLKVLEPGCFNCTLFDFLTYLLSLLSCFGPSLNKINLSQPYRSPFTSTVAVASLSVLALRLRWGPRQLLEHVLSHKTQGSKLAATSPLSLPISLSLSIISISLFLSYWILVFKNTPLFHFSKCWVPFCAERRAVLGACQ